ncbi:universal stress protein [Chitinophaga qingshengii]|uniref:Universal stress protein n=1 Tax=Chitinophaga qingshengii TaxID=1569794 RepID=A0ABR7TQT2_9BACT|nr:universal stress protein [Chitinophaga qingshengii]MBC9932842.1 universal stress protein [Chitinophaga qingshengii]
MKTIIVATDFSPAAWNAACYAADMAKAIGTQVVLLHVYTLPVSYGEMPIAFNPDQMLQDIQEEMSKLKQQLTERTAGKVTIEVVVKMGNFYTELEVLCERLRPYVVILGSQGTTAAERLLLGGHTVFVMRHLEWPLITVPPERTFTGIKKIGLACDFSHVSETVPVKLLQQFADDFHAELHILNVEAKRDATPAMVHESDRLHEMLAPMAPHYHYSVHADANESLMEDAELLQLDLLVVLPKHHDLLHRLTHKSHTRNLTMHCPVPLMALQP